MCNCGGVKMCRYLCKHNLNKLRVLKYSGLNSLHIKRIFQLTSQSLFICHSVKINSNIVTYFFILFLAYFVAYFCLIFGLICLTLTEFILIYLNSFINRMFSYLFPQFMFNSSVVMMCRYLCKINLRLFGFI